MCFRALKFSYLTQYDMELLYKINYLNALLECWTKQMREMVGLMFAYQ